MRNPVCPSRPIWFPLDKAKELAEFLALVSAAVFFLYKAYTGYFRVNLSLSLACQRRPNNGKADDTLVLSLRMKKGVNGSLTLHDVAARVSDGQSTRIIHFVGIARSGMRLPEGPNGRATIDWSQPAKSPFLKLIPDEEVECNPLTARTTWK